MRTWLRGKEKHLIFWSILVIYALAANPIYVQYFMKNGKPLASSVALPAQTNDVTYLFNQLEPVVINGQNLYELRGFAYPTASPTADSRITLILSSTQRNVAFAASPVQFPYMINTVKGYTKSMDAYEFSLLISNDGLAPGVYRVGVLVEDTGSGKKSFVLTHNTITKTYNTIQYTAGKD